MATFVATIRFTENGIKQINQTMQRATDFEKLAEQHGAKVIQQFWTMGDYDGLIILEAPNDETASTLMLKLGALGFVQPKTCRAYTGSEMKALLANV